MKVVGAFERFGRIVMVFEDGSMGKVVGFKRADAKPSDPCGEPVLLNAAPVALGDGGSSPTGLPNLTGEPSPMGV